MRLTIDGIILPVIDTRTPAGQPSSMAGRRRWRGRRPLPTMSVRTHRGLVQHYVNALVKAVKWLHNARNEEIINLLPGEF